MSKIDLPTHCQCCGNALFCDETGPVFYESVIDKADVCEQCYENESYDRAESMRESGFNLMGR